MPKIYEYRGVEGLVAAPVTTDTAAAFETGTVFDIAGVSEIAKSTDSTNESHYYDNVAAVVISSTGADEISMNTSAIPLDVLAQITGQAYDAATGMFVEQERTPNYFALGYKTKDTNGNVYFVWRLKGRFGIPAQTNATENDGTDANGQELVYTGVSTIHQFTKTGKKAKAITVDTSVNPQDAATFFGSVQTPDTVTSAGTYSVVGVGVSPSSDEIEVGDTVQLIATVYPSNATNPNVTWTSSDDAVATVSESGLVTGIGTGTATITATTADGSKTDTCSITVS